MKLIEWVGRFKYLERLLDRSDKNWTTVFHNIWKARQVWGRLGKLLWREEAEPTISEKFYRAEVQAVLLFGSETWVITETTIQRFIGSACEFLEIGHT